MEQTEEADGGGFFFVLFYSVNTLSWCETVWRLDLSRTTEQLWRAAGTESGGCSNTCSALLNRAWCPFDWFTSCGCLTSHMLWFQVGDWKKSTYVLDTNSPLFWALLCQFFLPHCVCSVSWNPCSVATNISRLDGKKYDLFQLYSTNSLHSWNSWQQKLLLLLFFCFFKGILT